MGWYDLKTTLGRDHLRCKSSARIHRELLVRLPQPPASTLRRSCVSLWLTRWTPAVIGAPRSPVMVAHTSAAE